MRAILGILAIWLLAGCVPAPYGKYYKPSYPDPSARLGKAYCSGQAGPPTTLAFDGPDGMRVAVGSAHPVTGSKGPERQLHVVIDLPAGARFRFLEPALTVAEAAEATGRPQAVAVHVHASVRLADDAWVDFAALGPTSPAAAEAFLAGRPEAGFAEMHFASVELPQYLPERLSLRLPDVEMAGLGSAGVTLELAPYDNGGRRSYREAGYEVLLQERYELCRKETPERPCENIPIYDPYGFSVAIQGFAWRGSFWSYPESARPVLRGDLELRARTLGAWRLAKREIVLGEAGGRRTIPLRRPTIRWAYAVPLETEVRATAAGGDPKTGLRIEAGLGNGEAAEYVVTLPPFELNGKRHVFAPIRLERRLFDGGIEPFNC